MNADLFAVLATALLRRRLIKITNTTMIIEPTQAAMAAPIIDVEDDAELDELALLTNVPLLTAGASVKEVMLELFVVGPVVATYLAVLDVEADVDIEDVDALLLIGIVAAVNVIELLPAKVDVDEIVLIIIACRRSYR
jgi:hypothetical protein